MVILSVVHLDHLWVDRMDLRSAKLFHQQKVDQLVDPTVLRSADQLVDRLAVPLVEQLEF